MKVFDFITAFLVIGVAHSYQHQPSSNMAEKKAVCVLEGQVKGTLHFLQKGDGPTKITGNLSGVSPPGLHGFHVHQYGDYSGGCASTGGHYNPHGLTHGGPTDAIRHAGDLGNIQSDVNGNVAVDISDSQIPLSGVHSIIGRAIVVHAGTDDLGRGGHDDSKTTGHAGGRIGCGVIGFGK